MSQTPSFEIGEIVYAKPAEIKKELPGVITYIHPKGYFMTIEFELFKESFCLNQVKCLSFEMPKEECN